MYNNIYYFLENYFSAKSSFLWLSQVINLHNLWAESYSENGTWEKNTLKVRNCKF